MLLLLSLLACENYPHVQDPGFGNTATVADLPEPSMVAVAGTVWYNQVRQNGVHVFLVDNFSKVVDEDINQSTGEYQLDADDPDGYWVIAGYDNGSEPLMAYDRVTLEEASNPAQEDLDLMSISENPAQDFVQDSSCYCSVSVWHMTFWSCEMESGWAWSECD